MRIARVRGAWHGCVLPQLWLWQVFRTLPMREDLLRGVLSADLVQPRLPEHCSFASTHVRKRSSRVLCTGGCAPSFHAAHRILRGVLPCAPAQNPMHVYISRQSHGPCALPHCTEHTHNIRDTCNGATWFQVHFHNFEHTRNMLSASQRLLGLEFKTLRGGFVSVDYYGRQAT